MLATPFLFVFLISSAGLIIYIILKALFKIIFLRKSLSKVIYEAQNEGKVQEKIPLTPGQILRFVLLSGIIAFLVSTVIIIVVMFISLTVSDQGLGAIAWIIIAPFFIFLSTAILTPIIYLVFRRSKLSNQNDNLK